MMMQNCDHSQPQWLAETDVCPGLFYGTPAEDGFLVRLRVAGGWLDRDQVAAIGQFLTEADRPLQVTNRANLQIRGIQTPPSLDLFQTFQRVGLAAKNPELDRLRNLMASPTAGFDPQELLDTRPLVRQLDHYIQTQPYLADLSSKLSIGFDGGGKVGIGERSPRTWQHRYNEIQFSAVAYQNDIYLQISLSGDRQAYNTSFNTSLLFKPDDYLEVFEALVAVYLEYLADDSRDGTQRKERPTKAKSQKRRMKHLLQDWGLATYLDRVQARLADRLILAADVVPTASDEDGYIGVHRQRSRSYPGERNQSLSENLASDKAGTEPDQDADLYYVGVSLPLGQVTQEQWQTLGQLAAAWGQGQICLTPWQAVLLPHIPADRLDDLLAEVAAIGLSANPQDAGRSVVACAGRPGCSAAQTHTQRHALRLADHLRQQGPIDQPINIHLTGCDKCCAQPAPGEITLVGTKVSRDAQKDVPKTTGTKALAIDRTPVKLAGQGKEPCTVETNDLRPSHHDLDETDDQEAYDVYWGATAWRDRETGGAPTLAGVPAIDLPREIEQLLRNQPLPVLARSEP